jgi:ribosomal protein S3
MKKSGEVNKEIVRKAKNEAYLPQGVIGVEVWILPPDVQLPDEVKIKEYSEINVEKLNQIDPEIAKKFQELLEEAL